MPVWKHASRIAALLRLYVFGVTLTCCSCRRHGKQFQCLRVCETIVPFVLIDLNADKSPAHKVSNFGWGRCHAHLSTVNGLTFLSQSNHTKMLCNALVSVPQLSAVTLILATDISNCVRRRFHCLNWQPRVYLLNFMSSNGPQTTNTVFNIVCSQLCSCALHRSSCCNISIQRHLHGLYLILIMMPRHLFQRFVCVHFLHRNNLPCCSKTLQRLNFSHLNSTKCCLRRDLQFLLQQTRWSK